MYINVTTFDEICILNMNRPDTNSLDQEFLEEIYDRVCQASKEERVKVVILMSRLPFGFSSGMDLGSFIKQRQTAFAESVFNAVHMSYKIVRSILQSPKIFIAVLAGPVIGSAASITFSCDFRIAAPGTWFWLPDPQYGGFLADGGIELLAKHVGNSRTFMLALTNGRINLDTADEWGLIYKIAERQKLEDISLSTAKRLCGFSFNTFSSHKRVINEGLLDSFKEEQLKKVVYSKETYQRLKSYIKK